MQKQIVALVQAAQQGDQQATQQIQQIMQAAQQGDQQAIAIAQTIQQITQQMAQSAKFGAKLNYVKYLKGICPQGYEMQKFEKGGAICQKCVKKNRNMPNNPIDAFKCGRKMKKKACGGMLKKKK